MRCFGIKILKILQDIDEKVRRRKKCLLLGRSISKEYDIRKPSLLRAIDLIQEPSFQRAIDLGLSTARNVSNLKIIAPSTKPSSPSFFHARNQKPRDDVHQLGDLAIHSATVLSYLSDTFCK